MAKKFFDLSDEEKKVLEGTDAGKAILKKLEEGASLADRAMLEAETKLSSTEKARKELEESLLSPDLLEAISNKRTAPQGSPSDDVDLDSLPPSKLIEMIRKENKDLLEAVEKNYKTELTNIRKGVGAALQQLQLDALEDKHGEKFVSRKDKLAAFAVLPENQNLRPRDIYAKFLDKEELEAKRQADATAKAAEEARQKELASFAENPDSTISRDAAGSKDVPKNADEAFERAWDHTPGADKLLHQG